MKLTRVKLFLFFLLFGALIVTVGNIHQYLVFKAESAKEFQKDAKMVVTSSSAQFYAIKEQGLNILLALKGGHFLEDFLKHPGSLEKAHITATFFDTMTALPHIMQLRYLDNEGSELIKLNREMPFGEIEVCSGNALQNKSDRYYFKDIQNLHPDEFYISEFDLNIEHNKVERPLKPTLRFGTQVYHEGEPEGMIILNLFMTSFVESIRKAKLVELYLVDHQGYFLIHPDASKSWSRYLNNSLTVESEFGTQLASKILSEFSYEGEELYSDTLYAFSYEPDLRFIAKVNHSVVDLEQQEFIHAMMIKTLIIVLVAFLLSGIFGRLLAHLNKQLFLHSELLNNIGDGIFVHDTNGKLSYVNSAACTDRGYTEEELLQIPIPELDAPEYKENIHQVVKDLKERGYTHFRVEHLRKDRSRVPLDVKSRMISIDGQPNVISVARDITKQLEIERKLQESEERYRALVETAVSGIFQTSVHGEILFANTAMKEIIGFEEKHIFGHTNIARLYKDLSKRRELLHLLRQQRTVKNYEFEIIDAKGREHTILLNATLHRDKISGMFIDITDIKKAREQITTLSKIVEQTADSVAVTNIQGEIYYVNEAFTKNTGYTESELIGNTQRVLKSGHHTQEFYKLLWDTILSGKPFHATFVNKQKDGKIFHEEKTITPLTNEAGEITGFVSTAKDITERVAMEDALRNAAQTDHLTGLYNRVKFDETIGHEVEISRRYHRPFSLILFDIDHFKAVNDTYGHDIGDSVLKQLSNLLKGRMRKSDIIARWGGEEFIVLLPETAKESAIAIAEEIRKDVEAFNFTEVGRVTISLGVTSFIPSDSPDNMTKRADEALYRAKAQGRNRVEAG